MFNNNPKKTAVKQVKKEHSRDYAVTILTNGCHFAGKMYCRGSTRVGGRVEGEIVSEGLLILEEEAVVDANITCEEIVLQGKITGTITAKSRVEMSRTCTFSGDVITPSLVIEEGAVFTGRSTMDDSNESLSKHVKLADDVKGPNIGELSGSVGTLPDVNIKSGEASAEA
ncbi:MAG: polymer-forming cytoskeletal protein [Pseudobacteriovorax sp.]|nr:polymer-forming cytoskeletal protein [Pseudobacteriovorax sp.]